MCAAACEKDNTFERNRVCGTFKIQSVSYFSLEEALVVVCEQRRVVDEKHNRGRRCADLKVVEKYEKMKKQ